VPKRDLDPLISTRVRLRLLEPGDLPMTLRWRNRDDVRRWFFDDRVLALDDHRAWFERYRERDDDFVFIVEDTSPDRRPIGQVSLYRIDTVMQEAEFGRMMIPDPADRFRGLATEASLLLLHAAFAMWALRRVVLEVYAHNDAALRLWTRCGFQVVSRDERALRMDVTPRTLAPLVSSVS
jgi:diamine N-acetyltransferase